MIITERITEISKKYNLSHLGSCYTSADIINEIYHIKRDSEPFILSCGHAALALYCVIEKHYGIDAEYLYLKHGTHPNRDEEDKIFCSTGSLGWGLPIAAGMALSDRKKNVYCLISDGESFEGTMWETGNLMKLYDIDNLKVYCNFNGYSAYREVDQDMMTRLKIIIPGIKIKQTSVEDYGLQGLSAHYCKL